MGFLEPAEAKVIQSLSKRDANARYKEVRKGKRTKSKRQNEKNSREIKKKKTKKKTDKPETSEKKKHEHRGHRFTTKQRGENTTAQIRRNN